MSRTPSQPSALERDIDGLFAQPLADFIAARNALAARLKKEGHAEQSTAVKALGRPSISAWAVNQVFWHARGDYERLLAAGDALRRGQEQMLAGRAADLREAMRERQDAARTVVDRAMGFLRDIGNAATDATRQRIAVTVDALAAYGREPRGYAHGRLERDLDPPGFEALGFLSGMAPAPPTRAAPAPAPAAKGPAPPARNLRLVQGGASAARPQPAREDAAAARLREKAERAEREQLERERREREKRQKAAIDAAEREVTAAERALQRAVAGERDAAADHHSQARETEALRRQLAKAEEQLGAAAKTLEEARDGRERAERTLADARHRREMLDA